MVSVRGLVLQGEVFEQARQPFLEGGEAGELLSCKGWREVDGNRSGDLLVVEEV